MIEDTVEDPLGGRIDQEIDELKAEIKSLKAQRALQVSNIISSSSADGTLPYSTNGAPNDSNPLLPSLLDHTKKQLAHTQECLYRTCAGITTFKVSDPDPNAVDNGKVLGIRIEAFVSGRFLSPYYVFVNKPYPGSGLLRVHRHTVPPCIPLAALAARYLPTPTAGQDLEKVRRQNLLRFVRELRREIAGYHARTTVIADMRKKFGLDARNGKGKSRERGIRDVSAADAEAKQIRIEWDDDRAGRVVMSSKGDIERCVVVGDEGRDREMERRILGGNRKVEDLAQRISGA